MQVSRYSCPNNGGGWMRFPDNGYVPDNDCKQISGNVDIVSVLSAIGVKTGPDLGKEGPEEPIISPWLKG